MNNAMNHKIVKTEATQDYIEIVLANGTKVCVSSNNGYIHIHMSGINVDQPIKTENIAANQLDIRYTPNNRN